MYALAGICFFASITFGPPIFAKQLAAWQVLPRSEPLTELYFKDYRKLPTTLQAGAMASTSFVIHNLEHQHLTYRYEITAVSDNNAETLLGFGDLVLSHDQSRDIRQSFTLPSTTGSTMIKVTLHYNSQSKPKEQAIHYWVTMLAPRGGLR